MKLYGGRLPDDFEFRYRGVVFLGQAHQKIEKLKAGTNPDDITGFFTETPEASSGYIFICASVHSFTHSSVRLTMKDLTCDAVNFLSAYLKRDFTLDPTDNYLIANRQWKYQGGYWSSRKYETPISQFDIEGLNDNPFKILNRHRREEAAGWFLSKESLYVDARRSGTALDYWKYLEGLISYPGSIHKVENILPNILLLNARAGRKRQILMTLVHGSDMLNGGMGLLGITYEELRLVHQDLRKGIIPDLVRKLDSVFVEQIISEFDDLGETNLVKIAHTYYIRALIETYGLRNFQVHRGLSSPWSQVKIQYTIPTMVTRFRWLIYEQLKEKRHHTFGDLILYLSDRGQSLLNDRCT